MTTSCTPPAYHRFLLKHDAPSAQYGNVATDRAFAFEIAAGSEVDRCIIVHQGGKVPCAVGSPAVGPFIGPFGILSTGGAGPCTQFAALGGMRATQAPPRLGLVQHFDRPIAWATGRGASTRYHFTDTFINSSQAGVFEIPMYGRRRCSMSFVISEGGPTELLLAVRGRHFFRNVYTAVVEPEMGLLDSVLESGLIVNPNADVTLGPSLFKLNMLLAPGGGGGFAISVESESFHSLLVYAEADVNTKLYCLAEMQD